MRSRVFGLVLAASVAGVLAGCDRGATNNSTAPGRPGAGNPTAQVAPATGDTPANRSNAVAGSAGPGGKAGSMSGASGTSAATAPVPPGGGLQGGMGAGPAPGASSTASPVPDGSTNATPGSATGNK